MENTVPLQSQVLEDELRGLREQLKNQVSNAENLRDAYNSECRWVPSDDAKLVAAKLRFDNASAGVERTEAEITNKERLLDETQGREAEENRKRRAQQDFEIANGRLSESKAELDRLRAEYSAMPDKIRLAEWQFHQALRNFNEAKSRVAGSVGT